MIADLAMQDVMGAVEANTVIIGAGIAGLLLACRLRERGVRVVVLESGGRKPSDEAHALNRVEQLGEAYAGAREGRARGLGGTSTIWGGAMIPFLPEDLQARPHVQLPVWPIAIDDVEPYVADLEKIFGIEPDPHDAAPGYGLDDALFNDERDFLPRAAKWPAFKKRNVAALFKRTIERDPDLSVWLNATAAAFDYDEGTGRLTEVVARHISGRALRVRAEKMILCAGAIESTRLLLLLDRQLDGRAFQTCTALGRYFHDHVSTQAADIQAMDPRGLNRLAGYKFSGSTMRSPRFELSPSAQAADGVGSAFGHITFQSHRETGFDAIQDFLRSRQRSGGVSWRAGLRASRDLPYLMRAAYWRYVRGQLLWPEPASYQLHVVAEQAPRISRTLGLSTERDPFGLPLAAIDWRVDQAEHATIGAFARRFDAFWRRQGLTALGQLNWFEGIREGHVASFTQAGGLFHPGGTTRMGLDVTTAVVDRNLRTFAIPNLWVASTSAFPSGPSANPTMMLMLLTLRLADHLVES